MSYTTKLWRQVATDKRGLGSAALIGALASLSAVALMGVSAWLISTASEMPPVLTLSVAAVSVRFFALARALLRYLERLLGHNAALEGLTNLRITVFQSLERITPIGLGRFSRGDFLARLGADVDGSLDLPLRVVLPWLQAALVSLATVTFVWWLLPSAGIALALTSLIAIVIAPILIRWFITRSDTALAQVRSQVTEAVVAIAENSTEINMSGIQRSALNSLNVRDERVNSELKNQAWTLGLGTGLGVLLQGISVVTALALGIPAVTEGRLQPVMLAVLALLPLALFEILSQLPAAAVSWKNMEVVSQRIIELEDFAQDNQEIQLELPQNSGVEAFNVTASWSVDAGKAIRNVNITISQGQHVAVVGPSGSGKSTLAYTLMGYLPFTGKIAVEKSRAMLTQQSHIFDTTIRNNVQIGGGEMSASSIEAVLERASLMQWLSEQPEGLETELGNMGERMSGGEKQRLAFARLLAANAKLLILDEPTEHLDFETAELIEREIWSSTTGTTTIMVTHRLTAAQHGDQIIEMNKGQITAIGSHNELMALGGWYAENWASQVSQNQMLEGISQLPIGHAVAQR